MAKKTDNKRKSVTFKEVAEMWISSKENLMESTMSRYQSILYKMIIPKIGKKKMKNICNEEFLEGLKAEYSTEGYSESTIANVFTVINSVIRYHKGLANEVYVFIARSSLDEENFSQHEAKQIIRIAKDDETHVDYVKLGVLIIMYTGVSISELCALKWCDIDTVDWSITVSRALNRVYNSNQKKSPLVESEYSEKRYIPISPRLKIVIKAYQRKAANCYVLTNGINPMEPRTFQNNLNSLFKKARMEPYSSGDLKDMFIANALSKGVSILVLAEITGMSISHLCRRYSDFISVTDGFKRLEIKKVVF